MTTGFFNFKWWSWTELNRRHAELQSAALPTELHDHKMATPTGLEPVISSVTGRRDNQLRYGAIGCGGRTRTCDLRVMSPASYQLLYPALFLNSQ